MRENIDASVSALPRPRENKPFGFSAGLRPDSNYLLTGSHTTEAKTGNSIFG